jgi:hypothetical protein
MNSNGRINELVLFGKLDAAVERPWTGSAPDGHNRLNPGFAGASDYLLTVSIKLLHFEMRVGIDEDRSLVVIHWSLVVSSNSCGDGRTRPSGSVIEVEKRALFQSGPDRHVFEETRQHRLPAIR